MTAAIEFDDVSHTYDGGYPALRGVSFAVQPGELVAVVGPNGSGKTTLSKHTNGLLRPTGGTVRVAGSDAGQYTVAQLTARVGFIFQNPDRQIFCYTVWDEVLFALKLRGLPAVEMERRGTEALASVGLDQLRDRHPRTLSGGQRQRLAMATVFAMQTEVLVLDEPTTGQDYHARRQIMRRIQGLHESGLTILMVTHDMALVAEYASRVLVICEGRLLMDASPQEVFRSAGTLAKAQLEKPTAAAIADQSRLLGPGLGILTWGQLEAAIRERLGASPPQPSDNSLLARPAKEMPTCR